MKTNKGLMAVVMAVMGVAFPLRAQVGGVTSGTTSSPTTVSSPAEGMTAVVEEITGNVRVRKSKDAAWEPAVVGMELAQGAEIRTGIRSAIRCGIAPDQTFTLDRLGTIEVSQAAKQGNLVKTDLTMKYGRAQYRIEKAGLDHDATISSPGSTLAVRGTTVELEDSPPFRTRAVSYTGRARFTSANKTSTVGSKGGTTATMTAGAANAASVALLASVIDPQFAGARTKGDAALIAQQVSFGATARFDKDSQITVITGGAGPVRQEADLVSQLPGKLNFVARWTNDVDVNLQVTVDKGSPKQFLESGRDTKFDEFIYPGFGLNSSKSGGRIDFDHRGGANGGQEIVYWKNNPPVASYGVALSLVSNKATDVTLNAFFDGKKLPMFAGAIEGSGPVFSPTLTDKQVVDIGGGVSLTVLRGKSTTFTIHLEPTADASIAAVNVYLPLDPSLTLAQEADLNNNAPANLPTADTTAPNNTALKGVKLRPVSQAKNKASSAVVAKKSGQVRGK